MDLRSMRRDLERYFAGLAAEYEEEVAADGGPGGPDEEENDGEVRARIRLRRADTVPPLFAYQRELVEAVEDLCRAPRGRNVGLLTLPTGAGKTRTAAVALMRILTNGEAGLAMWLAPTRELLGQAIATLESVWRLDRGAADLELVRADMLAKFPSDVGRGVVLATPQMMVSRLRRGKMPNVDVVVFDEAHHVEAPVFRRALEELRGVQSAAIIGLSATPGRTSERETERLVGFFGGRLLRSSRLGRDPISALQSRGVLARVAFKDVPLTDDGRRPVNSRKGGGAVSEMNRFRAVVRLAGGLGRRSRVLVFAESVDHARLLAAALRCQRARAVAVSSRDREATRRNRLRAFERGELSVLVNRRLLATGYDCPAVRHVVLATRIGSPILFEQIVGRASRGPLVGGHARSTVWQFEDHLATHGLPQSYYRYSDYDWDDIS